MDNKKPASPINEVDCDPETEGRSIKGYPDYYRVTADGFVWTRRVRGHATKTTDKWTKLSPGAIATGHSFVVLRSGPKAKTIPVHCLVLEYFLCPCPEGMECCHNDNNPRNNKLSNLRWDTHKANMADKIRHGTSQHGERSGNAKLTNNDVLEIRRIAHLHKQEDLAKMFGVCEATISHILTRRNWKHI